MAHRTTQSPIRRWYAPARAAPIRASLELSYLRRLSMTADREPLMGVGVLHFFGWRDRTQRSALRIALCVGPRPEAYRPIARLVAIAETDEQSRVVAERGAAFSGRYSISSASTCFLRFSAEPKPCSRGASWIRYASQSFPTTKLPESHPCLM